MLKVLFVCDDMYPQRGPCSNVILHLCIDGKLINKSDMDVHILTPKITPFTSSEENIEGITVHRIYIPESISLKDFLACNNRSLFFNSTYYYAKIRAKIRAKLCKNTFFNERISEKFLFSLMSSPESFDAIIPISGNFTAFNAALDFKEKKSYQGKIILIQVDPCSSNGYFHKLSTLNRQKFEQRMLKVADIIFALPQQYREYQQSINDSTIKNKIRSMEIPSIIQDASTFEKNISPPNCTTKCVFAGQFYKNIRNPDYLISLFNSINYAGLVKIKLFLLGMYANRLPTKLQLKENIVCLGPKTFTDTKAILNSADFLVNLGNSVSNQVPSKIFDYISFGKPIIHIRKLENDPSMEYLNKYPLCLDLFEGDSIETNVAKLEDFISKNKGKRVDKDYIATTYKECTPEYCAEQLYQAILEVTHSGTQEEREAIE